MMATDRCPPVAGGPGWVPRVVATDLDGTLLDRDGRVGPRNRAAVEAARSAGALIVPVTGRPPRWLGPMRELLGSGPAVCANGALVVELADGAVLVEHRIESEVARAVVTALKDALGPTVGMAVERADGFAVEPAFHSREDAGVAAVGAIETLLDAPAIKLLARVEGAGADDVLAVARSVLADLPVEPTHSAGDGLVEVAAAGVSKASTVARVAAEVGAGPADVVAFGDMPNDVELLAWAGWGVAVGAAHPEVCAVADEVTGPDEPDGVAVVLDRLFA